MTNYPMNTQLKSTIKRVLLPITVFVLTTSLSYGQISVSEMIKVYSMDYDKFEDFVLTKGWEIDEIKNDENYHGIFYKKGNGLKREFLGLFDRFYENGKKVQYQTCITDVYIKFKNQLKESGFKLYKNSSYKIEEKDVMVNYYRNNSFEIRIYILPPEIDGNSVGTYEIGLTKYSDKR